MSTCSAVEAGNIGLECAGLETPGNADVGAGPCPARINSILVPGSTATGRRRSWESSPILRQRAGTCC